MTWGPARQTTQATGGIVVGNPVLDEIRRDGVLARHAVGGTATYAALALRRLGAPVTVVGAVGNEHADMLLSPLAAAGACVEHCERVDAPSTSYLLDYQGTDGERQVRLLSHGPRVRAARLQAQPPAGAAFVHLGPVAGEVSAEVVEALWAWGLPMGIDLHALRCFDAEGRVRLGSRHEAALPFHLFDTVKGSIAELRAFAPEADSLEACLKLLTESGVNVVLATDGSRGAWVFDGESLVFVPAFAVEELDPTGAGDVFLSAFLLARHVRGESLMSAALFAASAASFSVQGPGTSALGNLEEVLERRTRLVAQTPWRARDRDDMRPLL